MLRKKILRCPVFILSLLSAILGFLFFSCEQSVESKEDLLLTGLSLRTDDNASSYSFVIDILVKDNVAIYLEDEALVPDIWQSAIVRWGFREKSIRNTPVYWVQKTESDLDVQNSYSITVKDAAKQIFSPYDLPDSLLGTKVEVYAFVQVGNQFSLSSTIDLPSDFAGKVLGALHVGGNVLDQSSLKPVTGASISFIHKNSGKIFHTFTDAEGKFQAILRRTGEYNVLLLHKGFIPSRLHYDFTVDDLDLDLAINPPTAGDELEENTLYEVTDSSFSESQDSGPQVTASLVNLDNHQPVANALLLFYNHAAARTFVLAADRGGKFSIHLPDAPILSVMPSALGYVPEEESIFLDGSQDPTSLLQIIGFRRNPDFSTAPLVSWRSTTSGGPGAGTAAAETLIPYYFDGTKPIHVTMDAEILDPLNAGVQLEWTQDGQTLPVGLTGTQISPASPASPLVATTSFDLNSPGQHTIRLSVTNAIHETVQIFRTFYLDPSTQATPTQALISWGAASTGGASSGQAGVGVDSPVRIGSHPGLIAIITLELVAIDPTHPSGDPRDLVVEWYVDGQRQSNRSDGGRGLQDFTIPLGTHSVRVRAYNQLGESTEITRKFAIQSASSLTSPIASWSSQSSGGAGTGVDEDLLHYPYDGFNPVLVTLDAQASSPGNTPLQYIWYIDGIKQTNRASSTEVFSLAPAGEYEITAVISNLRHEAASITRTYELIAAPQPTSGTPQISWGATSSGGDDATAVGENGAGSPNPGSSQNPIPIPYDGVTPVMVRMSATVSSPAAPLHYRWFVDRLEQTGQTGSSANFNFATYGLHTITVEASDASQNTATLRRYYRVVTP